MFLIQTISKLKCSCEVQHRAKNHSYCRDSPADNTVLDECLPDLIRLSCSVTHCQVKFKNKYSYRLLKHQRMSIFRIRYLQQDISPELVLAFYNPICTKSIHLSCLQNIFRRAFSQLIITTIWLNFITLCPIP